MENKKGFTLIELIVVVAIIAILALILVPQVTGYIDNAKEVVCISNRKQLETAITIGLITGDINEQDLIDSNGEAIDDIATKIGFDISNVCPVEGILTLNYEDEIIKIICSEHYQDTSSSSNENDTGGENEITPSIPIGSILITDKITGAEIILKGTYTFDELVENINLSDKYYKHLNLELGDTITDGNNLYAVINWNLIEKGDLKEGYSLAELASKNGSLKEISKESNFYTSEYLNTITTDDEKKAFTYKAGDIKVETVDGKKVYYYQPADGNFYDANGQWKKLNLSEEDLN
jgi:prepilin-type N-terminal cleavage/methylation domain-containing protein